MVRARWQGWAWLWAAAILFQLLSTTWWATQLRAGTAIGAVETALAAVALALLLRPQALRLLPLLALLQLWDLWLNLPVVPNHRVLTAAIHGALLLALWVGRRDGPAVWWAAWAPVARLSLVLLYAFSLLHKLNSDFLRPDVSCAVLFYDHIVAWLPLPHPPWLDGPLIWGALLTEALIPLGLLHPRTRRAAVLLSGAFHFFLALDLSKHFLDFSATVYALLYLFAPSDLPARWAAWQAGRGGGLARAGARLLPAALAVGALLGLLPAAEGLFFLWRQLLWTGYALTLLALWWRLVGAGPLPPTAAPLRLRPSHALPALLLPLLLLNGAAPYLGLKSKSAFDMYSNLRMEGGAPNHLLIPGTLDLLGQQRELVTIVASSDDTLQGYAAEGLQLTWLEFADALARRPASSVTFRYRGVVERVARAGDDPRFARPLGTLARKLLWFRPVDSAAHPRCQQ